MIMKKLPHDASSIKQLETFTAGLTKDKVSRLRDAYVPGLGTELLNRAPEAFRKMQMEVERLQTKRSGKDISDRERFRIQLTLMGSIRNELHARQTEQLDRDRRLVNAFQKLAVNKPRFNEECKLFVEIEGSNVQRHQSKRLELAGKVHSLQQVVSKTDVSVLSEQSRNNLVRDITELNRQNSAADNELKDLKPDQDSVNKAFIKASQMSSDRYLKSLQAFGFKPSEGIHGELSAGLATGTSGTNTVRTGQQLGLGERIIKTLSETARFLFTPSEKYEALTNRSFVNNETALKTKNDHAVSYAEMAKNESEYSFAKDERPLRDQIEMAAARLELRIDWSTDRKTGANVATAAPEKTHQIQH